MYKGIGEEIKSIFSELSDIDEFRSYSHRECIQIFGLQVNSGIKKPAYILKREPVLIEKVKLSGKLRTCNICGNDKDECFFENGQRRQCNTCRYQKLKTNHINNRKRWGLKNKEHRRNWQLNYRAKKRSLSTEIEYLL